MGLCWFGLAGITLFVLSLQCVVEGNASLDIPLIGKSTDQSSTTWSGIPDKAVDGNTNGDYGGSTCTHTDYEVSPWWMVDIGAVQCVGRVEIFNRDNCCRERLEGAIVRVGLNSNRENQVCKTISLQQINANQKVEVTCDLYGQYISIELPCKQALTLCEVKAFRGQCQENPGIICPVLIANTVSKIEIARPMVFGFTEFSTVVFNYTINNSFDYVIQFDNSEHAHNLADFQIGLNRITMFAYDNHGKYAKCTFIYYRTTTNMPPTESCIISCPKLEHTESATVEFHRPTVNGFQNVNFVYFVYIFNNAAENIFNDIVTVFEYPTNKHKLTNCPFGLNQITVHAFDEQGNNAECTFIYYRTKSPPKERGSLICPNIEASTSADICFDQPNDNSYAAASAIFLKYMYYNTNIAANILNDLVKIYEYSSEMHGLKDLLIGLNRINVYAFDEQGNNAECTFIYYRTRSPPTECYCDPSGRDYRGMLNTSKCGKTCQSWTSQFPHIHSRTPSSYPDTGLGDHNYCRNPDKEPHGPWCYTTDPSTKWEYCDVGMCINVSDLLSNSTSPWCTSSTSTTPKSTTISQSTAESARISQSTAETTAIRQSTAETTPISQSTSETTTISQSTVKTTTISQSTAETTAIRQSTAETATISKSTAETTAIRQSTAETTTISQSTAETTTISQSTAETNAIRQSTAETTTISQSTAETTAISQSTAESTTISQSTADTTTISKSTAETTTISQSTAKTITISQSAETATISTTDTDSKTITRSRSTTEIVSAPFKLLTTPIGTTSREGKIESPTKASNISHYYQSEREIEDKFNDLEQNNTESLSQVLLTWDTFSGFFPELQENETRRENKYFDLHVFENILSSTNSTKINIRTENQSYALKIPVDSWNLAKGISIVVYVLKLDLLSHGFNDSLGNMFEIGSRILSVIPFRNRRSYPFSSEKVFDITFSLIPDVQGNHTCQYITSNGSWSKKGCYISTLNDSHVTCSCNHMTSFAVMMQLVEVPPISEVHDKVLQYLTNVLMSISIMCLLATLIIYTMAKLYKSTRIALHANLAASLLFAQLVFLTGINAKAKATCIAVTVMLHYLWLVVFMWMLMEGVYLFLKVMPSITWRMKICVCMPVAWGAPSIIVFTTLGIRIREYAGLNRACWLPTEYGLIYAFAGPAFASTLINAMFLVIILRKFMALKTNQDKSEFERIKASVRAVAILMPLLGITWVFGVLQLDLTSSLIFGYLFIICNGLQGVFLFITQCLLDDEVKAFLRQKVVRGRVDHSCDTENT